MLMRPFGAARSSAAGHPRRRPGPLESFGVTTWPQALLKWGLSDPRCTSSIHTSPPRPHDRERRRRQPPWFGPDERDLVTRLATRS